MHEIYKQKMQLLFSMDEMISEIENGVFFSDENRHGLRDGLIALGLPEENIIFEHIVNISAGGGKGISEFRKLFNRLLDAQVAAASNSAKISENYRNGAYGCDREFMHLMDLIRNNSAETLQLSVYENLKKLSVENSAYYDLITAGSRGWYMGTNWLDGVNGANNSLIINRVTTLKLNIDRIEWLYINVADSISRRSLNALIKFWLTWNYIDWKKIAIYYCDVVDTNIFPFYDDEVFVDCGSYIGDTVEQYVNTVNSNYRRIYTYDISTTHIDIIKKNLAKLPNVVVNHKGTGDKSTEMSMVGTDKGKRRFKDTFPVIVDWPKMNPSHKPKEGHHGT